MIRIWPKSEIYVLPILKRKDIPYDQVQKANRTILSVSQGFKTIRTLDPFVPADNMYFDNVHLNTTKGIPSLVKFLKKSLVETWSDSGKPVDNIPGFDFICNSTRKKHKRARRSSGGIALYVRSSIYKEPGKDKSISEICPQYQQSDFMNNNHYRSNSTASQKSHNHKNFCAKIFHEVAQQTDENKNENVRKSPEVQNNVCGSKSNKCFVIDACENSTRQKSQNQDAKIFHEVAQQTDENRAENVRRSLENQKDVYITEQGHRSLPFQIIESYGNVNEAEIHGTIDKASNSSNTNVNTDTEFLRGQGKEDNQCQTENEINQEQSFDGEMKEDVVNVLIEVENTGSIDQKNFPEKKKLMHNISEHFSKRKDCQNIQQQAKFKRMDRAMNENQDEAAQINDKDELLKVGNIVAVRPYTKRDYKPGRPWIASLKEIGTRNVKVVWLSGTYDTKWIEDPIYFPHSIPRKQVECSFVYDYQEPLPEVIISRLKKIYKD
ncbi:unnamed protein product [Mytilus coruscus]|uniref:Uncharacterized protein n=1 Tax=Mytilus coruscus TaxID=42192 RepID=A0A6J8CN09_MYTCO|nr:unnamed protein product [Mytilus coruscus]